MQIWPELMSLVHAIRFAATLMSASADTMTGLLPPSSSVTGVRCDAAPSYTFRPISVPPVNRRWSKPCAISSWLTAPSPSMTAIASVSRYRGTSSAISADDAGATSDGLSTNVLPAAIAPTAGPSVSANGTFQAPMISTVPYGSYSTQPRPGSCDISSRRWRRLAHLPTFFAAYAHSPLVLATSASQASNGDRPRSFSSASAILVSFSTINCLSARNCSLRHSRLRVRPVANVLRSRATVLATSELTAGAAGAAGAVVSVAWVASVVMGIPFLDRRKPNPNQPSGWATGTLSDHGRSRSWLFSGGEHVTAGRRSGAFGGHELRERIPVVTRRHAFDPAVQPAHLVAGVLAGSPPAVVVEPSGDVGPIVVLVDQVLNVDGPLDAEFGGHPVQAVPHLLATLVGMIGRGLGGDPTARCAQFGDLREQPVLGLGRQIHQQPLGQPCRRRLRVESLGDQGSRPVLTQVDRNLVAVGRRGRTMRRQGRRLVLQHLGLVDLVHRGASRPVQPVGP